MARPKGTTNKPTASDEKEVIKEVNEASTEKRDYSKKVKIPQDYEIPLMSNVQGTLVYVSRKTHYKEEWNHMGDVAYFEYAELVTMRNSNRKFFENNWVIIKDTDDYTAEEIYYNLGIDKYYKNTMEFNSLDDIFDKSVTEIRKIIPTFSKGYKENIASRALQLIKENDKRLDSNAKVKALEETLGYNLRDNI